MPPKRTRSTRASAKKTAVTEEPPSSSEDAKPNIDQLDAEAQAEAPVEPSSDLTDPPAAPKYEPLYEDQSASQIEPPADAQQDSHPDIPSDSQILPPSDPVPESEPASTVIEVGASASTATPTRRLDSLGSSRGRGKASVAAPRFAGRRAQARREQLQKAEEKRKEDEAKAAKEASRKQREMERRQVERGRGGGRARGRGRGRDGYGPDARPSEPIASGPFSAGQVSKEIQQKNTRWSSRGSGWKGYKPEGRADSKKGKALRNAESKPKLDANGDVSMAEDSADDHDYLSSDDEEINGQRRMNVEKLGIIDLTQDDNINPNAPIRIARVPHKERNFGDRVGRTIKQEEDAAAKVDTVDGDEIAQSNDKQQDRDVEGINGTHGFQAVFDDSDTDSKPRIKSETDFEEIVPAKSHQAPSSAQTKRKGKEKIRSSTLSPASVEEYDEEVEFQREEEQRRHKDLAIIRDELGNANRDGDAVMSDGDGAERRADNVYLFQLPPILPDLEPVLVKPEPDAEDAMQVDGPSNPEKPITVDEGGSHPKLPPGAVGKMRVHASGKVTIDWGGLSLALGLGGKSDFLQSVVSMTLPDQKFDLKEERSSSAFREEGQAITLGHVKEKFVVTPDWEDLLG